MGLKYIMSCWTIQEGGIQRWKNITEGFSGEKGYKWSSTTERGVVKDLETDKRSFKMDRMCEHKNKSERERWYRDKKLYC